MQRVVTGGPPSSFANLLYFANELAPRRGHFLRSAVLDGRPGNGVDEDQIVKACVNILRVATNLVRLQLFGSGSFVKRVSKQLPAALKSQLTSFNIFGTASSDGGHPPNVPAGDVAVIVEALPLVEELQFTNLSAEGSLRFVQAVMSSTGLKELSMDGCWEGTQYSQFVGSWASSLESFWTSDLVPLPILRDIAQHHRSTLQSFSLPLGTEQTQPPTIFDLPAVSYLSLFIDGSDQTLDLFKSFRTCPIKRLYVELLASWDEVDLLVDAIEEELEKRRSTLQHLAVTVTTEELSSDDEDALEHLRDVCGGLGIDFSLEIEYLPAEDD